LYTGIGLVFSGAILLGWVVLIVVGALSLRAGQRGLGTAFVVIGGLWGLVVLLGAGYGAYALRGTKSGYTPPVAFNAETHKGPVGTLTLDWKQASTLNVRGKQGKDKYKVDSTDGSFRLPAGTYMVESWNAKATDSKGIAWTLETRYPRNLQNFEVRAEGAAPLALGPPLEAAVSVGGSAGSSASFGFTLKDAAGNDYAMMGTGTGTQPPGFEVVDETGKVVWSGKFEFG
jgi:hypothetical protein